MLIAYLEEMENSYIKLYYYNFNRRYINPPNGNPKIVF